MRHERVAEESDEVASASGAAELLSQEEQVGHRVLDELFVAAVANMDLDGEPEAGEGGVAARDERV